MDIVDAQVHLWSADTPDRPWPPGRAQEAQKPYPISKEALLFQMEDLEWVMGRGVCEWLGWPL
jgi:predicted TIM-barrel fold metal-dependent hydrolase